MSRIGRPGSYLYEVLSSMIQNNVDYFKYIDTEVGNKILDQLSTMQELLQWIETSAYQTLSSVQSFDFDAETPANGYRSFLTVIDRYIILTTKLCRALCIKRDSVFFRSETCLKELTDYVSILRGLKTGMSVLVKMMEFSKSGDLFVNHINIHDLFQECDGLDPTGFYGRCVGFYYCDSIRRTIRKGHAVMAAFRDQYYQPGGTFTHTTTSLISFGKYLMDPSLRAKQIVEMRRHVHVDFLKAMWSLNDLYIFKKVNKLVFTSLPVCHDVIIPLELQSLPREGDEGGHSCKVDIPYPGTPGTVPPPLHCRLLSLMMRDGQQSLLPAQVAHSCRVMPASAELVLHCHGGGFIAQSAESHEIYLRDWAKQLNVPVLSVDYSLSPESPFPRALEEVLYTYSWALNNCHKLGWTGERICVAGDSAGGILALALCLRTIELCVRRPDAVFCAYTPVMLNACPTPSKVLSCVDPLVPLEFLLTCVHAYLGLEGTPVGAEKPAEADTQNEKLIQTSSTNGKKACTSATPLLESEPDAKNAVKSVYLSDPSTTAFESTSTDSDADSSSEQAKAEEEPPAGAERPFCYQNAARYHNADGEAGEEVIFEAQPSPSLSARQKAVLTTKPYVNNVSSAFVNDKANVKKSSSKERIRKDSLPWFHPQNPSRMKTIEAIEKKASNPLISPYLAPDVVLQQMPPAYFMCLHLDPTLDDTIMFAKKLRSLGCTVSLKVLDFLPHGFLNLFPRGNEAQEGIECCVDMIRKALKLTHDVCE
ncbi:hormone-sensitive lipase-like [Ornithodoros turicata]|uniref:hormone-sensitive lipase-like n=1 Tax=Ornithodoros turicata TaxID=34597 RepID=UPI00313A2707